MLVMLAPELYIVMLIFLNLWLFIVHADQLQRHNSTSWFSSM